MEAAQMTDKQFDKIIKMIRMVLDGCKDQIGRASCRERV